MMADATANGGRPCLLLLASSLWLAFFPERVGFIVVLYDCESQPMLVGAAVTALVDFIR